MNDNTDITAGHLVDKTAVARFVKVSKRCIDGHMANGMPHLKLSPRCVRFDLDEVKAWLSKKYGTRRFGKAA